MQSRDSRLDLPPLRRRRAGRPFALLVTIALSLGACRDDGGPAAGTAPASGDAAIVRAAAHAVTGAAGDYDPLLALVTPETRLVFLGDATHGTHEFYAERARITQRLVAERGFTGVAIEGSWPDAYRVNEYVRGLGGDGSAEEALSSFDRFPEWMWRNAEVRDYVRWLHDYNAGRPAAQRVGFYGLDVQSLYEPMEQALRFLDATDPAAAGRVRSLYACFEPYRPDGERYGAAAAGGANCEPQALGAVAEVERVTATRSADPVAAESQFAALRSAHAVANAEAYYRSTYSMGSSSSWNVRDTRMASTLDALLGHLSASGGAPARVAVWAHNTHSGDARHTQMGTEGEINIGQLARQGYGEAATLLVGFLTYTGQVQAATGWGRPGLRRDVNRALPGSFAALFHETGVPAFVLPIRGGGAAADLLVQPRLERAIGVVYAPESERASHYFTARLGRQFDAVVFFDVTHAVTPLPAGAAAEVVPTPAGARGNAMLIDR